MILARMLGKRRERPGFFGTPGLPTRASGVTAQLGVSNPGWPWALFRDPPCQHGGFSLGPPAPQDRHWFLGAWGGGAGPGGLS